MSLSVGEIVELVGNLESDVDRHLNDLETNVIDVSADLDGEQMSPSIPATIGAVNRRPVGNTIPFILPEPKQRR